MMRAMKTISLAAAVLSVAAFAFAADDPLKAGPGVYKKTFENERVRVMEVTFKPSGSIAMHTHPSDHVVYVVTGGKLVITGEDGKEQALDLTPGQTVWMPAGSHKASNPGKTTVKLVVTELKK